MICVCVCLSYDVTNQSSTITYVYDYLQRGSNHYDTCDVCSVVFNNAVHVFKEADQQNMARYVYM